MTLCLMTISMGIVWGIIGYQIYRKRKFFLINRYVDGKMTEQGALMTGKLEIIYGLTSIPAGIAMFFMPDVLVWVLFGVLHLGMMVASIVCQNRYRIDS